LEGYDTDPNCLYVVTVDAIRGDRSDEAMAYIEKMDFVFDKKTGFNPALKTTFTPGSLRQSLKFEQKLDDEIERNARAIRGIE
jgi:hypothetical protein